MTDAATNATDITALVVHTTAARESVETAVKMKDQLSDSAVVARKHMLRIAADFNKFRQTRNSIKKTQDDNKKELMRLDGKIKDKQDVIRIHTEDINCTAIAAANDEIRVSSFRGNSNPY